MPGAKKSLSPEFIDSDSDILNKETEDVPTSSTASQSSNEQAVSINNSLVDKDGSDRAKKGTAGRKRHKGRGPNGSKSVKPCNLRFLVSAFSASELKKKEKDRIAASASFELAPDEPYDTFVAQLLAQISKLLSPKKLEINDYTLTYTIKQAEKQQTSLNSDQDFLYLLERATSTMKPEIKIVVAQKASKKKVARHLRETSDSEREVSDGDDEAATFDNINMRPLKKHKTAPKKSNIDPANTAVNDNIRAIKAEWACNKASCASDFCWVSAENEIHLPLGHGHFNVWAAGMELGEEIATVRKPPNHALFNGTSDERLGNMSSLLKKWLEDKKNLGLAAPSVTVNMPPITIPPITFPQTLAPPILPASSLPTTTDFEMLIPGSFTPGPKMLIADFCEKYELDNMIRGRLIDEGYRSTASFVYARISDFMDAGFKRGEVFEIKVAISQWAIEKI